MPESPHCSDGTAGPIDEGNAALFSIGITYLNEHRLARMLIGFAYNINTSGDRIKIQNSL